MPHDKRDGLRQQIILACDDLAAPYDHLSDGRWVDERLSLHDLVENIVSDLLTDRYTTRRLKAQVELLTQQVKDERGRTAKALAEAACVTNAFQDFYREANKQKGGE